MGSIDDLSDNNVSDHAGCSFLNFVSMFSELDAYSTCHNFRFRARSTSFQIGVDGPGQGGNADNQATHGYGVEVLIWLPLRVTDAQGRPHFCFHPGPIAGLHGPSRGIYSSTKRVLSRGPYNSSHWALCCHCVLLQLDVIRTNITDWSMVRYPQKGGNAS